MDAMLDLYNFDSTDAESSKYVLTSPRSLEACSRLKIKPVELLQKTFAEFSQENVGKSSKLIEILYNDWNEKRSSMLHKCRQEREKIIMEQQINKKHLRKRVLPTSLEKEKIDNSSKTRSVFDTSSNSVISHFLLIDPSKKKKDDFHSCSKTNSKNLYINKCDGLRSRSVDSETGNRLLKPTNGSSRSLLTVEGKSNMSSGYITPQIQRDRRLVELMKERRKLDLQDNKLRRNKILEWSKEQKQTEEIKKNNLVKRQKELAENRVLWEKKLKEDELRKTQRLRNLEEEKALKQEQNDAIIRENVKKQEKLRILQIEERKKIAFEKKQKQERNFLESNLEIMAFQKAVEDEIFSKQERSSQIKLDNEMKELQKVKLMNRKQHERYIEIQSELTKRQEADEKMKKVLLEKKLEKAAENYSQKVINRDLNMRTQAKQTNEKINQTRKNLKKIDKENEEYLQSVVQHKDQKTQKALNVAQKTIQNKANRAKTIRKSSEVEWRKNLELIHKKDKELIDKMKESLELKEDKVNRHLQLKEAALEFSRVQAKINEAERESIKRNSTNFQQMAQQARLAANVGRGPRSSFVNYSTVKLG